MSFKMISTSEEFFSEEKKYELEQKYSNFEYKRIPIITELSKVYSLEDNLAIK